MLKIGLIKEGKIPADNRVALSPEQCKGLQNTYSDIKILVEPCSNRCFADHEYKRAGIELSEDLSDCNLLMGIKEVPINDLISDKRYMFFSHTKKKQSYNRQLLQAIINKNITLIDYECLEHDDGQRILGFGFFAGVVGAHNGMMAYGKRTGSFELGRVYKVKSYRDLIHTYFGLKLPNIKIVVTGSGRVSSGILEVMNLLGIIEVDPDEYIEREFSYPVYVHLKGADLYEHKVTGKYNRLHFHTYPNQYQCKFINYIAYTDILMNGIYWDTSLPRLFTWEDMLRPDFKIVTIADVSDDINGSVPCNFGDSTIENPVYGADPVSRQMIDPYQKNGIDIMAVGNLPNELPRDASRYFGDQLIKFILDDIRTGTSTIIERATIVKQGKLTETYNYLEDFLEGKS